MASFLCIPLCPSKRPATTKGDFHLGDQNLFGKTSVIHTIWLLRLLPGR
ncbi:hypothetical protein GRAN_3482 [Granulicella sibirica]|uniref:Uncharacterized protein n=1 Tax=Granulicella sibirica TaxID=2479048 RepID=A0A4Q0SZD0_9BACT|nr:hypothetical protein GRAN_3482 [Granulicella sibirica]